MMSTNNKTNKKDTPLDLNVIKILLITGTTLIIISGFVSSTLMWILLITGILFYGSGLMIFKKLDDKPFKYFTIGVVGETIIILFLYGLIKIFVGEPAGVHPINPGIANMKIVMMTTTLLLIFYPLILIPVWFNVKMLDALYSDTGNEDFRRARQLILLTYLTTPVVVGLIFGIIGLFYLFKALTKMKVSPTENTNNSNKIFNDEFKKYFIISTGYTVIGLILLITFLK